MKDAVLWKRILNERLMLGDEIVIEPEKLQRLIIVSTIILDRQPKPIPWNVLGPLQQVMPKFLPIPLDRFWVEGTSVDGTPLHRWGCFAWLSQPSPEDGTRLLSLYAVTASDWGIHCHNPIYLTVHKNGEVIDRTEAQATFMSAKIPMNGEASEGWKPRRDFDTEASRIADWVLSTILHMGCKNVSIEPVEGNDPKQIRRAEKRIGVQPHGYRYHVLVVRPAGAGKHVKGEEIGTMPYHLCRGHYAEYGPEFGKGLLFGKLAGRFLIPPHHRGDKKNGTVEKDYAIPAGGGQ